MADELGRELFAGTNILVGAYLAMFLYVSLSLGDYFPLKNISQIFVKTKFLLGLAGVVVVLCSIIITYGLCALAGVKASLVVNQVLPFLILAIGVDNVFILSNTYQSLGNMAYMSSETRLGETLARVGKNFYKYIFAYLTRFEYYTDWNVSLYGVLAWLSY
jgi:Niemann-Pick C1 protein